MYYEFLTHYFENWSEQFASKTEVLHSTETLNKENFSFHIEKENATQDKMNVANGKGCAWPVRNYQIQSIKHLNFSQH